MSQPPRNGDPRPTDLDIIEEIAERYGVDLAALIEERDLLRAKLTAHHAIHNLPKHLVRDWAISYGHTCPVCKEVEDARTTGE